MLIPKSKITAFIPTRRGNMKLWKRGSQLYAATESGNYFLMQEISDEYPHSTRKKTCRN